MRFQRTALPAELHWRKLKLLNVVAAEGIEPSCPGAPVFEAGASANSARRPMKNRVVPRAGFEPARLAAPPSRDGVSASSTTWALDHGNTRGSRTHLAGVAGRTLTARAACCMWRLQSGSSRRPLPGQGSALPLSYEGIDVPGYEFRGPPYLAAGFRHRSVSSTMASGWWRRMRATIPRCRLERAVSWSN